MPATMIELKERLKDVFNTIHEETLRKSVMNMKVRAKKFVHEGRRGKALKGRSGGSNEL